MKPNTIAWSIGVLGLLSIIVSTIIDSSQSKIVEISWLASLFIFAEALYVRYYVLDIDTFSQTLQQGNDRDMEIEPTRYANWMVIAMVVGLIATITIHYNFIIGMLTYLLMQICLIIAFSGIFSLNPIKFWEQGRKGPMISVIAWIMLISVIYIFGVYNGSESLIVIPYVVFLGAMAHYSWYNLSFPNRNTWFKLFPIIASSLFVFSDAMIGNAMFGPEIIPSSWFVFIDLTYVFNLFFFVNSQLMVMTE